MSDEALKRASITASIACTATGAPFVPPERLLKAMVWMALYGIRSEVLLYEQLDAFSGNRKRRLEH